MKYINSIIAALALSAPALTASPMPEKADKLASNTVVAQFLDLQDIPCRHLTADCPNNCDHATKVARFRVRQNENYDKCGEYGDDKIEAGSIMMVDVKKPTPGQDDAAVFALIDSLKPGDTVRLTQTHYYGEIDGCLTPFRPITAAEKVEKKDRVPATPAAPGGQYPVMPLAK